MDPGVDPGVAAREDRRRVGEAHQNRFNYPVMMRYVYRNKYFSALGINKVYLQSTYSTKMEIKRLHACNFAVQICARSKLQPFAIVLLAVINTITATWCQIYT